MSDPAEPGRLAQPRGCVPVDGSDWHRPGDNAEPGSPTTWLLCEEPSAAAVLDALAAGRTSVAADPAAPALLRHDGDLVAVDAENLLLCGLGDTLVPAREPRASWATDLGRYWLETPDGTVMAITR